MFGVVFIKRNDALGRVISLVSPLYQHCFCFSLQQNGDCFVVREVDFTKSFVFFRDVRVRYLRYKSLHGISQVFKKCVDRYSEIFMMGGSVAVFHDFDEEYFLRCFSGRLMIPFCHSICARMVFYGSYVWSPDRLYRALAEDVNVGFFELTSR